jgi:hypothetical protein
MIMNKNDIVIQQLVKCAATTDMKVLHELARNMSCYIVNNLYKLSRPLAPAAISYNLHANYDFSKATEVSEFCLGLVNEGVLVAKVQHNSPHYQLSEEFRSEVDYSLSPLLEISIKIKGMEINGRALRGIVRVCRNHLSISEAVSATITEMAIGDRIYNADEMKKIIEYVEDKEMFYDKPE